MSELLYGAGFVLVYEAIYLCNKAYGGSRSDRPLKPGLFYATYCAAIVAGMAIIIDGFVYFHWWIPIAMRWEQFVFPRVPLPAPSSPRSSPA